jgi:uncharacterized membrane protein YhaH (DUF805 family)
MTMDWNHLFLSFSGRTGKRDFWIGFAALFAAGIVANLLPVVGALAGLALLYPWTALMAKRLHDFGRSGWLVLVPAAPAALSAILALFAALAMGNAATMGAAFATAGFAVLVSTVAMLIGLGFLVWVGLKDGDAGTNTYGARANNVTITA